MTDIFPLLQKLSWRGIRYPVSDHNISFLHENVDHRIQYRSNDYPEPIGPHSFLFKYTIPMRESISHDLYGSLFNEGLPILIRNMRNKEPGELIDPILGTYRAIPVSYTQNTDINKRDGVDVSVEFLHAPRIGDGDPELPQTITGIANLAVQNGFQDEVLKAQDWNQEPSPEGMTDILSAINGLGRQALRQGDRLSSQIDSFRSKLDKIEETADKAENPQNWRIRDSARQLNASLIKVKERLEEPPDAKIKRVATRFATTVSRLAADAGMTTLELLKLNPGLSKSPVIKQGTSVAVKQKK